MRKAGIVLLVVAAPIALGLLWLLRNVKLAVFADLVFAALVILTVLAVTGLLMAVTGLPIRELAMKWNALRPWQRGVLGTGLVLVCLLVFGAAAVYSVRFGWMRHS